MTSHRALKRLWQFGLGAACVFGLLGCAESLRQTPACDTYFTAGDMGRFKLQSPEVVKDTASQLLWYRCAAGMAWLDDACVGDPAELSFEEAQNYAAEFSKASGKTWRVPSYEELKKLAETKCDNPAFNPTAFPNLPIENLWTTTTQLGSPWQACTVYSFTGVGHCRTRRTQPLMFLLVHDPKKP